MNRYDAVLFDNDGVLVPPPARETQVAATRAAFREVGVEDPDDEAVADLVDGVTVDRLHEICAACGVDPATFWAARERHDEHAQFREFRAGDRECYPDVTAVEDLSPTRGVVSNNHHSTVAFVLEQFDLAGLFDTYHGREKSIASLARKKPDPHYLDRALAAVGADDALYVGDAESDVVAARRAGLDSALVRRDHNRDAALSTPPTHEVDSLHDLRDLA